jgi:mRNA interferase MazF
MRRGEVRWVDLGPGRGSEATGRRPAIVVSNDQANASAERLAHGKLTVVPITSNVTRVYPFQVLLPAGTAGLDRDSKAQAEQVRWVPFERVGELIGQTPPAIMESVDAAMRLHLAL